MFSVRYVCDVHPVLLCLVSYISYIKGNHIGLFLFFNVYIKNECPLLKTMYFS
jgi:hypothetical protein